MLISNPEKPSQDKALFAHVWLTWRVALSRYSPALIYAGLDDGRGPFRGHPLYHSLSVSRGQLSSVWTSSVRDFQSQKQQEKSSKSTLSFKSWGHHWPGRWCDSGKVMDAARRGMGISHHGDQESWVPPNQRVQSTSRGKQDLGWIIQ